MTYRTFTQITQDVIKRIGLVAGTGVQIYTEPQVEQGINDAFDFLFRKRYWEHLSDWFTYTVDATTGMFTADIDDVVKSHDDAKFFYETDTRRKIVQPVGSEAQLVNNTSAIYYKPVRYSTTNDNYLKKLWQFLPVGSTTSVTFFARSHPGVFDAADTVVPFPQDIIGWAATWLVLETDGLNPGAANKAQAMFDISYRDMISSLADDVIGHGGVYNNEYVTIR